ncbi:UDP-glucose 4-epimerase [Pseudonocardia ailaonensis]|uniref:UDP-glucose 4-epimerase n=1 Tax=Pseudonocardia ailaonensis TaxID=367279 RepID=A0ABN2ND28_9PSEU
MADLRGRRVLVTGSTGFVGRAVVARLVREEALVHVVSRRELPPEKGVQAWRADLTDTAAVRRLVAGAAPEAILHLAAQTSAARTEAMIADTFTANLQASLAVLTAAMGTGARVVLAGSLEAPAPEVPAPVPTSPYAASKWAAAGYARMFTALFGVPTVDLRIAMVYGPAQPDERKVLPYSVLALLAGTPPELTAGTREVDWVYVDDVADAVLAAAVAPGVEGRSFDVGTGVATTIRGVVEQVAGIVGNGTVPRFGAAPARPLDGTLRADPRAAAADLGWRARVELAEGLRRTVEFYRARQS